MLKVQTRFLRFEPAQDAIGGTSDTGLDPDEVVMWNYYQGEDRNTGHLRFLLRGIPGWQELWGVQAQLLHSYLDHRALDAAAYYQQSPIGGN